MPSGSPYWRAFARTGGGIDGEPLDPEFIGASGQRPFIRRRPLSSAGIGSCTTVLRRHQSRRDQSRGTRPAGGTLWYLILPIDIWFDASGRAIQAMTAGLHSLPQGSGPAQRETVTLSGFGTPVRAVAPPAKDVTSEPVIPPATMTGLVVIRGSDGKTTTATGAVVLQASLKTAVHTGKEILPGGSQLNELATVDSRGAHTAIIPEASNTDATQEVVTPCSTWVEPSISGVILQDRQVSFQGKGCPTH